MNKVNEASSRDALFGYRLRFAPETQPIRQTILDNLVLRNIRDFNDSQGATVGKLCNLSIQPEQEFAITQAETKASLSRLEQAGLVRSAIIKRKHHWFLTQDGKAKIQEKEMHCARMREDVVAVLFGADTDGSGASTPFFEALGLIFDDIAVGYIEAMFSERPSPVAPSIIDVAVTGVAARHPVDRSTLTSAIQRFFRESTPEFDWIKWTYCKNYYSVRALGLGAGTDVLSATLFSGSTFFLDTNVVICALDSTSERHLSAKQVLQCLSRINCQVKVLQITLVELRELAERLRDNLGEVLRQIPDGLLPKVRGFVARAEARHRKDELEPTPEQLLNQIGRAETLIIGKLNASIAADDWFDTQYESQEIVTLAESLRQHYDKSTPLRRKTGAAALHDALALSYMAHLCRGNEEGAYFVTLDRSLPHYHPASLFDGLRVNRAMTLDALMPWLSAVSEDDEGASLALSGALANDLIPSSGGYNIQEFRMLAELGMDCGRMPSEDVEQCLLYLRREARDINLATAEDREKLHALVKGFFSSPDRHYLAELNTLRSAVEDAKAEAATERARRREYENREQLLRSTLREKELRGRVARRLAVVSVAWVSLMIGTVFVAFKFGSGENALQKIGNFWWLFGAVTGGCAVLARQLCRGELWETAKGVFRVLGE